MAPTFVGLGEATTVGEAAVDVAPDALAERPLVDPMAVFDIGFMPV